MRIDRKIELTKRIEKLNSIKTGVNPTGKSQSGSQENTALKLIDEYYAIIDNDEWVEPEVMDTKIEGLTQVLKSWEKAISQNPENQQNFDTFKEIVTDVQKDWVQTRPLIIQYLEKEEELEKALEGDDPELIIDIMEQLEQNYAQIVNQ